MFRKKKIEYINIKEMNEHLAYCRKYRYIVNRAKTESETFANKAFVVDKMVKFELSYRVGTQACTYICRKDNEQDVLGASGLEAYTTAQKYYKAKDFRDDKIVCKYLGWDDTEGKFLSSAKPFTYYNPKYNRTRHKCIGYDLNSSYSNAMLGQLPDTNVPYHSGIVKDGEVGFNDVEGELIPVFKGHYSMFIFPLMDSPYQRFVNNWYSKKKKYSELLKQVEAKKDKEAIEKYKRLKAKAKDTLNFCIGYMQRTNPFLRAIIIWRANKIIKDLMNDDVVFCNTDSLVCLDVRDDINIGDDIGQFKIEHKGDFAYIDFSYQWNKDKPHWKHIPQSAFPDDYDILSDPTPACTAGNIVKYVNYRLEYIK